MFVFLIQVVPNLFGNSDCGEEARDLTDGYFYWSGDVISEPTHAPLSKGLFSLPIRLEGADVSPKNWTTWNVSLGGQSRGEKWPRNGFQVSRS
jgi:hypothetical protein